MTAVAWQHSISMTHRTDFAVIPYVSSMLPNNEIQKRDSRIFYVQHGKPTRYDTMRRVRHNAGMAHCKGNGEPQGYSKHGVPIAMSEVR